MAEKEKKVEQGVNNLETTKKEKENLKKEMEEVKETSQGTQAELSKLKETRVNAWKETSKDEWKETSTEELKLDKLYSFGKTKLDKKDVQDTYNEIWEPYKSKIRELVNGGKVNELQQYLNGLLDDGTIDVSALKSVCEAKWIWLQGGKHISADWKFWPQTMEALRMLKGKWTTKTTDNSKETTDNSKKTPEVSWGFDEKTLRSIELKYVAITNKVDFSKTPHFKDWVLAEDGSLNYLHETYKKVEKGEKYEGFGYRCGTTSPSVYKFVDVWLFKEGKMVEWVRIYDDGERHIGKFNTGNGDYLRVKYSPNEKEWSKNYGRKSYVWWFEDGVGPNGKWKMVYTDGNYEEWVFEHWKPKAGETTIKRNLRADLINPWSRKNKNEWKDVSKYVSNISDILEDSKDAKISLGDIMNEYYEDGFGILNCGIWAKKDWNKINFYVVDKFHNPGFNDEYKFINISNYNVSYWGAELLDSEGKIDDASFKKKIVDIRKNLENQIAADIVLFNAKKNIFENKKYSVADIFGHVWDDKEAEYLSGFNDPVAFKDVHREWDKIVFSLKGKNTDKFKVKYSEMLDWNKRISVDKLQKCMNKQLSSKVKEHSSSSKNFKNYNQQLIKSNTDENLS